MPSENPPFFAQAPGDRFGYRWSQPEEDYVFARFCEGDTVFEIANRIGRGQRSVVVRLQAILGIPSEVSPQTLRTIAEQEMVPLHQATRMGAGSNRRRGPQPLTRVAQDFVPGVYWNPTEARPVSAEEQAQVPSPTFPYTGRFNISPSFLRDPMDPVERTRGRTAAQVERERQVTFADIQRAGEQLDRNMTLRPSLASINEAMHAATPVPMEVGTIDRFSIVDPTSRVFRTTAPQRPTQASAPQRATTAANPTPAPQSAQPVRQPFSKHQRAALIATLRELRGPGSSAALDAVARAIATQTPGFDAEEFKTACRELVPA